MRTALGLLLPVLLAAGGASAFLVRPTPQRVRRPVVALQAASAADGVSEEEHDVVVIGSGIGGLCAAAVAATYGLDVAVVESHVHAGGAAHAFERDGFLFDSGPSLFSGLSQETSPNPLKHVFDFIGEKVDWVTYDTWGVILPEGGFDATIGPEPFNDILAKYGGPKAFEEWGRLMTRMAPLSEASMALPPAVIRNDAGVILTMARFFRAVLKTIPSGPTLQAPFSAILEEVGVTDPFIKNWLSLLCFLLQGMPPEGTMTAVMAYMLADWYRPGVVLDYPAKGTGAVVDALARGVTKRGGKLHLGAHVEAITVDQPDASSSTSKPRATGVRLRNGRVIKARKAVISNASIWNTRQLLPAGLLPEFEADAAKVGQTESFLHLHVGIDAAGLGKLNCHYAVVDDWSHGITAPGNVIIISIPSLLDPSLAPAGCHTIHAYTAGNEPFSLYEGLERNSPEYKKVKAERSEILWRALEKVIPDVRSRVKVGLEGTPLTHARFLRRDRGTYGPAIRAGMPAVAASGTIAANNVVGIRKHFQLLSSIRM